MAADNPPSPLIHSSIAPANPSTNQAPNAALGRRVAVIAISVCLALGVFVIFQWPSSHSTDDAYLVSHVHALAPRVSGTVIAVLVDDNQHVEAGQPMVQIDPSDFLIKESLASAQIAQSEAQIAAATAQIANAAANIRASAANLKRADQDYTRAQQLIAMSPKGISQQDFEASKASFDANIANQDAARAQFQSAMANREIAMAQKKSGEANLKDAHLQLSYTQIIAPVAGRVGKKTVEVGNRIAIGQDLMEIVEDDVWVVANFKETQLKSVQVGNRARITVDAVPGVAFDGFVDSSSPATGAQFALLPPDNATGNFTKVVQRVPVKIRFVPDAVAGYRSRLTPGLSVTATILAVRSDADAIVPDTRTNSMSLKPGT